ncbi:MAG: PspC domain-containing protein [Pedobacter sp.]|nr:MAG: PspC domain-containing protein [Pedobacter sp.]
MDKRLFRNEYDKVVSGVSSGIAEYMEVDVTIIRLLFALSTIFLFGTGIMVYIVMWIVVPVNNDPAKKFAKFNDYSKGFTNPFEAKPNSQAWTSSTINDDPFKTGFKPNKRSSETGRTVGGLFLLVIGLYFLMHEFNIIPFWFNIAKLWPLVFVAIGVSFILKSKNKNAWEEWKRQTEEEEAAKYASTNTPPVTPATDQIVTDTPVAENPAPSDNEVPKVDDRFTKRDS